MIQGRLWGPLHGGQWTQHGAFCLRQVTGKLVSRRAGFPGCLPDEGIQRKFAGGPHKMLKPRKAPPQVYGSGACWEKLWFIFSFRWPTILLLLYSVGAMSSGRKTTQGSEVPFWSIRWEAPVHFNNLSPKKRRLGEMLGKIGPWVTMYFRHLDGALEIKTIFSVTFGKNKP